MNTNYAGFWLRFVAWFIDIIILGIIEWVIIVPLLAGIGLASSFSFRDLSHLQDMDVENVGALVGLFTAMIGISWLVTGAIKILYHSFFESSKYQGSIGKMAMSLIVTDLNGEKLEFGKAFVRNLCKIISNITLSIGYIIAGFTEKKQALHDVIAGTLVVRKQLETIPKPNLT